MLCCAVLCSSGAVLIMHFWIVLFWGCAIAPFIFWIVLWWALL